MSATPVRVWRPPGPVASAFMASRKMTHGIQGPVGSGKTSACLMKNIQLGQNQAPSAFDGVRKYRVCVVRDTYRMLWKTTIRTWWNWVPRSYGTWTGGKDEPASHHIRWRLPDDTIFDFVADFVAIGDNQAEDVLRGYEPTTFYLNEADLLDEEVHEFCATRAGRYPPKEEGGPTWYGTMMDFNAPFIGSWLHLKVTDDDPEFAYFCQPSGLSPQAENLHNLVDGYYDNMLKILKSHTADRMVRNKFGQRRDGKPVYPEFHDALHVASEDLRPIPGLPLALGLDGGGTPALVVWQRAPNGQWRALDELTTPNDKVCGPTRFGRLANQLLRERYPGYSMTGYADPSAAYGADTQADEKNWIQIVAAETKIPIRAAAMNNDPTPRREALRKPLEEMIDGDSPGLLISPRCRDLRRGLGGGFRFRRLQVAGVVRYDDENPEKNQWSHVCEAGEYGVLGASDFGEIMGRRRRNEQAAAIVVKTYDNPQGQALSAGAGPQVLRG